MLHEKNVPRRRSRPLSRITFMMIRTPIWWCQRRYRNLTTTWIRRATPEREESHAALIIIALSTEKRFNSFSRKIDRWILMDRIMRVPWRLPLNSLSDIFAPSAAFHQIIRALRAEQGFAVLNASQHIKTLAASSLSTKWRLIKWKSSRPEDDGQGGSFSFPL